jgi:transaldolase
VYVRALAAPLTVNTVPEKTLLAFGDHGKHAGLLSADASDAEPAIRRLVAWGVDLRALAHRLQVEGAQAFERSWGELLENIGLESAALAGVD